MSGEDSPEAIPEVSLSWGIFSWLLVLSHSVLGVPEGATAQLDSLGQDFLS